MVRIGDKVKLVDAKGLGKYGFRKGDVGAINSVANIEGKDMAMYMPDGEMKFYWLAAERFEVLEDDYAAALDT